MVLDNIDYYLNHFYYFLEKTKSLLKAFFNLVKLFNSYRKFLDLKNWAKQNKAKLNNKQNLRYLNYDNRYLTANSIIKEGEIICSFPQEIIINPFTINVDTIFESLQGITDRDNICIVIFLCREIKNRNSFYKKFIDFLPKDFSCFPYFFNSEKKRLLQNSNVEKNVKLWSEQLISEYNEISERKLLDSTTSLEEYSYMRHLVWSRNFGCLMRENQPFAYSLMVPIGDLYNYHPEKVNIMWYYDKLTNHFKIEAIKEISPGDEIFLNYGTKSNDDLLFYYGFTVDNNPYQIQYKFELNGEIITLENPLELYVPIKFFRKSKIPHIKNFKYETAALIKMKKHLISILNKYNTKLSNDLISLEEARNNCCDFNKINILSVLVEEKTLINSYTEFIDRVLEILKLNKNEMIATLEKMLEEKNGSCLKYLNLVKDFLTSN